ncbi:MAG: thioesterase family protein [Candidatus Acidiferrales bacterium]
MDDASISRSGEPAVAPRAYRAEILVRFGDCDPAGIVFYPRYLEIFNSLVEDWCRDELQFSFPEIINARGWGLPTVRLEVDFVAPSSFGDVLAAELIVRSVGTSSVTLSIVLRDSNGCDPVRGKVVLVLIDRKRNCSIAIPDELRARLLAFRMDQ